MENQEVEIKFFVRSLQSIITLMEKQGVSLFQPRTLEANLRFDLPDGSLSQSFNVLRLRLDSAARLTFKGPSQSREGVRIRQEIEFIVEDFLKARLFLEALGYQVIMGYEKYRTIYDLHGVHVTLDEMPYGNFVELEGPDINTLYSVNKEIGLDWNAAVPMSYTALFDQVKQRKELHFRDLTFENFAGLSIDAEDLGVKAADETI